MIFAFAGECLSRLFNTRVCWHFSRQEDGENFGRKKAQDYAQKGAKKARGGDAPSLLFPPNSSHPQL
jgi:hypothetical protein